MLFHRYFKCMSFICLSSCIIGKPIRQAYYFDLEDKVRRTFASKFNAEAMGYGTSQDLPTSSLQNRELRDCWDASIMESQFHRISDENKKSFLYFAQSHDGVEIQKNVTYTPITAKVLNLPTHARGRLACIWLLGFLPPNVKNYQNMLKPMVEMFAKSAPGKEPIEVFDAHQGTNRKLWTVISWITNDIRGVPNGTCGRHPPSIIGSCNYCCIKGNHIKPGGTVLVGAVGAVKRNHEGISQAYFISYSWHTLFRMHEGISPQYFISYL